MNTTTQHMDQTIERMLKKLADQAADLDANTAHTKRGWVTTCSYTPRMRTSNPVNIQVASQKDVLAAMADLLAAQEYQTKAAAALGLDGGDIVGSFTVAEWTQDFQKRIAILEHKRKSEELSVMRKRVESVMSTEHRRQKEIEALSAEMGVN